MARVKVSAEATREARAKVRTEAAREVRAKVSDDATREARAKVSIQRGCTRGQSIEEEFIQKRRQRMKSSHPRTKSSHSSNRPGAK